VKKLQKVLVNCEVRMKDSAGKVIVGLRSTCENLKMWLPNRAYWAGVPEKEAITACQSPRVAALPPGEFALHRYPLFLL